MSRKNMKALVGGIALLTAISVSVPAMSYDGFGNDIPLSKAASEIIPEGWFVDYADGVDRNVEISWRSADDWQDALQKALGAHGYSAAFGANAVVISKGRTPAPAPKAAAAPAASAAAPRPSKPRPAPRAPAPAPKAAEAPLEGGGGFSIRPYKGGTPAEDAAKGRLATKGEKFEPYKPAVSQYSVSAGQMLHPTLAEWASKSGWTVIWESEYDYRIEADAGFNGNFMEAVTSIVTAMSAARPAITVDFYQGNNVAVVSNKSADAVN